MKICETFRSIQGEGVMIGTVTHFIRSAGCNLSCGWCDTKYSHQDGRDMSVPELTDIVRGDSNICVTGGEPLLQHDIYELLNALLKEGKNVVLETNGSVDISNVPAHKDLMISMDIKCPSSGMSDKMLASNISYLKETDQLKFVIADVADMEYAASFVRSREIRCSVIFTPVGGMDMGPLAEAVLKAGLNVRVLPQLHKIIWGNRRSV